MAEDDSPYQEPPHLEGLNNLGEVLEGIQRALERPERFSSAALTALAKEVEEAAVRHGVYEPHD
jgi:hypothetical protein